MYIIYIYILIDIDIKVLDSTTPYDNQPTRMLNTAHGRTLNAPAVTRQNMKHKF